MIYLTGDTHGGLQHIAHFCARINTKPSGIMIILSDAGINFSGGWRDLCKKEFISTLPITRFCIHGNHEQRPSTIPSYAEMEWHSGTVYVEKLFPSILFAKDGEVCDLNGIQTIAIAAPTALIGCFESQAGAGGWTSSPLQRSGPARKANLIRWTGRLMWCCPISRP